MREKETVAMPRQNDALAQIPRCAESELHMW